MDVSKLEGAELDYAVGMADCRTVWRVGDRCLVDTGAAEN
jgi:hypothetical protein